MIRRHRRLAIALPLLIGAGLFAATIAQTDLQPIGQLARQLGLALPFLLVPSAVWHLLRTIAWRRCFPSDVQPAFGRTFRVRLTAEAFSWVTISGVAGEPLKVALLDGEVRPAIAAAAVALERIAYILTTAGILALSAAIAMMTLPLTSTWMGVFATVAAVALALIGGTVLFLLRRPRSANVVPAPGTGTMRSSVARFLVETDQYVRRAAQQDRRLLLDLFVIESAAYLMMAIEVWVVFRVIHVPMTLNAAFAVETLTRLASMGSAFIPGNLGALEASNVAAATAVHAAAGAAALALVRRIRGLFWCAGGFLIYPDLGSRILGRARARGMNRAVVVILEDPASGVLISDQLGGMPIGERVLRSVARAGCSRVLVWAPRQHQTWDTIAQRAALPLTVETAADASTWRVLLERLYPGTRPTVIAPAIVPAPQLIETPAASSEQGDVFRSHLHELSAPVDLVTRLKAGMDDRARVQTHIDTPALLSLRTGTPEDVVAAEQRLRESIFKPTDGIFGRFNRRMSIPISIALIRTMRLSAHAMTALVFAAGLYAGWLFSRGDYVDGVLAGLISWAASVLDGCDGELARLQYTDSAFGCWLDTFGDYAYYLSIFTGVAVGVARRTDWPGFWWIGVSLLVGVAITLGLLILLRGRITGGRPERLRTAANAHFERAGKFWTRLVARLSMCATRATMPYGLLLFAALNLLPVFVVLAAIGAHVFWISIALQLKSLLNDSRPLSGESSEPAY
jgi:phosphatidylglycerophosphate synthase